MCISFVYNFLYSPNSCRAQLRASEAAASDLFGFEDDGPSDSQAPVTSIVASTAGLSLNNPDSVDTYVPMYAEDFAELSRRIVKKLKNYQVGDWCLQFIVFRFRVILVTSAFMFSMLPLT